MKKELKEEKITRYLENILSCRTFIANPTELDIPEFGKVTATSMVNHHFLDGKIIPYFTFARGKEESGEFREEDNRYYVVFNRRARIA